MIFLVSFPLCTAGLLLLHHRDTGDTRCAEGGWRGRQLSYCTGRDNHVDAEGCALRTCHCVTRVKLHAVLLACADSGRDMPLAYHCVVPVCVPHSCVSLSVLQMVQA